MDRHTDRQTEAIALPVALMWSVKIKVHCQESPTTYSTRLAYSSIRSTGNPYTLTKLDYLFKLLT